MPLLSSLESVLATSGMLFVVGTAVGLFVLPGILLPLGQSLACAGGHLSICLVQNGFYFLISLTIR